jgi:hypothetical protein
MTTCLLNLILKVSTKIDTNRITRIAHTVINRTQYAVMLGRHILEGLVFLYVTIHDFHRKKMDGVLFEIYFEKA